MLIEWRLFFMGAIIVSSDTKWGFPYFGPNHQNPAPFLYQVELDHEIPPGMLFHDCLVSIANAHKQHPEGNIYACYGTWIGRGLVWLLYPLDKIQAKETLLDDEETLCYALGTEAGKKRYEEYRSTLISDKGTTLQFLPQFSRLKKDQEDTPMEYLYYITLKLSNNPMDLTFKKAIESIIKAHNQHPQGNYWVTYYQEQANELHIYAPMRRFSEMDDWQSLKSILSVLGDDEAHQARRHYYANVLSKKVQIMTFVPSCDNSGSEFLE